MNETKPGAVMNEQTPCQRCGVSLWNHATKIADHQFVVESVSSHNAWTCVHGTPTGDYCNECRMGQA